jgi:4-amino-4-deoxy-L-arabinose transferase-like glycosyltransferase
MDLRRVRSSDWLAAMAGAVLIASLFIDWYGRHARGSETGWQAFTVIDVILLVVGLLGIALVVANATQRTMAVPQALSTLSVVPALVGAVLVIYRTASLPADADSRQAGVWIALGAALTLVLATMKAMSDQRLPRARMPHIETIAAPETK